MPLKLSRPIFNSIIQVNPKWQNTAFLGKWDKKPVFLGTYKGLQKYKLLCQLDIDDIKHFGYTKEFQELQRKFPWYKFSKPHKSQMGWVGTPLSSDVYSKMSLDNWLQSMRVFNGAKSRKSTNDLSLRGDITEHHREFEKEVTENPDKFFDFLLQLKSENIHPHYLEAGLSGLIASNYDEEKVLKIIHLYSDIDDNWLKRTILKAIKYLTKKNKFDLGLLDILEADKDIRYEGLIREDDKFQSIHDHISSAINSYEGDFAELLPLIYKHVYEDKISRQRVLNLINEVIAKNIDFVIFGLLSTLSNIASVDKSLFAKLLVDLIDKDEIGQVSIYSLQNYHYLYVNEFVSKEQVIAYIKKCISFTKLAQDREDSDYINNLGMYLYYYYLNEKDEIFEELLNEAIATNSQAIHGVLRQIFEQELHSADEEKVKKSKQFILKFRNNKDNDHFYTFNLTKMNGLNFIQNDFEFVKSLASSIHIKKDTKNFIEYLQKEYYADTSITEKTFELLDELIQKMDSSSDVGYYDSSPLIEFILELNTRTKDDKKKMMVLDLIDRFLVNDSLRYSTKSAIE